MVNKKMKVAEKKGITRKDALRKLGFGAFTAGTMMLLLNTQKAQAAASGDENNAGDPGSGFDPNDWN